MNEQTHIHILQGIHWHGGRYILSVCATKEEAQALKDYGEQTKTQIDAHSYAYCYGYESLSVRSLPIGYRDNLLPKELPCQE